jgi:hypothetical protein
MIGVVQFVRGVFILAITLGFAGTLVEATGCLSKEAAKSYQRGGISFRYLNQQLINEKQKGVSK